LTQKELEQLLGFLEADRDRAGAAYNRLRNLLVNECTRRNHSAPDAGADAVLDRVAARLASGLALERAKLEPFCKGITRLVCLEDHRHQWRGQQAAHLQAAQQQIRSEVDREQELRQQERCLQELTVAERALLQAYYQRISLGTFHESTQERLQLAAQMGVNLNTLRLRVHRLRLRLEECVRVARQLYG
jgi:DNA-directed RNA polymerase specialized sigma24 family protein